MLIFGIFLTVLAAARGSRDDFDSDYSLYRDTSDRELVQDFYKRLASIELQDSQRSKQGDAPYGGDTYQPEYRAENPYAERDDAEDQAEEEEQEKEEEEEKEELFDPVEASLGDKSTMIRDPELTQHSSHLGILQMTEDQHSKTGSSSPESSKPSKSADDPLPFYCHPPNPCPKGYSSKDNCQEFIEDTAEYQKEWIQQMQRKGICSCDEEHMFDCSQEAGNVVVGSKEEMDKFFDSFVKEKEQENPFTQRGQKRVSLVAKKSPRGKRDTKHALMDREMVKIAKQSRDNPYLAGRKLPTVAKKGVVKRDRP